MKNKTGMPKKWTGKEETELDHLYSSLHWRVAELAKRFGGAGREVQGKVI